MALSQPTQRLVRRYLFASISLGIAVVVFAVYCYRFGILAEQQALLAQKRGEADVSQRNLRNSADLPDHVIALQKGVASLEEKLMRPGDVAAYQQFFFKLETDSSVKIGRLQPMSGLRTEKSPPAGAYRPLAFEATVDGTFADDLRFLRNLEAGPRHYRLVSFAARRGSAGELINLVVGLELLGTP